MFHMDPRYISHNFGYPPQHSQYYPHPSFWTPSHLSDGQSSLNLSSSRKSAFSVPVKREQSDGEESNRSSDSELSDEDDKCDSNHTTILPQTEALNCVLPGTTRGIDRSGLITPPDSSAPASPNTSLDSTMDRKSPEDDKRQKSAIFQPIYEQLSPYQSANFITPVPMNNFPPNLHKLTTEGPVTAPFIQTTHPMFSSKQMATERPLSPIMSPVPASDSQISPASVTSMTSPASLSSATDSEVKKMRTCYTARQLQALERMFLENQYPDGDSIERLSGDLDVAERNIKIWFQNKRARTRRRMQRYGPGAGTPTTNMMPGNMPTPPSHMAPGLADMVPVPAHMRPVPVHMLNGFPMPTPEGFPGSLYYPHALPFPSGPPFSFGLGNLQFPPSQHGIMSYVSPTIKKENITILAPSQPHHQPNNQSPIPFYHGLTSPNSNTTCKDKTSHVTI